MKHRVISHSEIIGPDGSTQATAPGPTATVGHREQWFAEAVTDLADVLADDVDVQEILQLLVDRCVEMSDVDAGAVAIKQGDGVQVEATSSAAAEVARGVESHGEGPSVIAYRSRQPIVVEHSRDTSERWPRFTRAALQQGYQSTQAIPMRTDAQCIGALNLFSYTRHTDTTEIAFAQALAGMATSGVLRQQQLDDAMAASDHLRTALDSRVIVEQAKGILAERLGMDPDRCFDALRQFCRSRNLRIADVASTIVNHEFDHDIVELTLD